MIAVVQEKLFEVDEYNVVPDDWRSDDWETPVQIARFMGGLVKPDEKIIVEPSAGRGNIARFLPNGTTCVELNPIRHLAGAVPHQNWLCGDFLAMCDRGEFDCNVDLVIGNPPFSLINEFISAAAKAIHPAGRILLLLPTECFQAQSRAKGLIKSGLHISRKLEIVDRVGYEQEGIVRNERQCYDSIFELRLSGKPAVEIVDPYGKL